jgi:predicted Fe-S protein YdhL (DUF1289 family)
MTFVAPASPCINVCSLDAEGYCRGCLRTRDEIAGWIGMDAGAQRDVIRACEQRRAARTRRPANA